MFNFDHGKVFTCPDDDNDDADDDDDVGNGKVNVQL